MAEQDTFYGKKTKRPFYFRLQGTDKVVRITATSQAGADKLADKIDPKTAAVVATDDKGNLLARGNDAVMQRPDGTQYLIGQGFSSTDPERIEAFAKGMSSEEMITDVQQKALLQENPSLARSVAAQQAMGFGSGAYVDEIIQKLFGGDYKRYSDALREAQSAQNPIETFLAQAGVGMFDASRALKAFPELAKIFGRDPSKSRGANVIRAAAYGGAGAGIPAAIQASGEAESGERLTEGLKTGGIAATTGGAIASGLPFAAEGANRLSEFIKASELKIIQNALGISRSAAMVIKSAFAQGGDINTAIQNIQRAGDSGMLADAGVAAKALADAAAQAGPEPAQTVATNIGRRAEAVKSQLEQTLQETLGDPLIGPQAAVRQIRNRTQDLRNNAYSRAYNTPIDYSTGGAGERIMSVIDRIDKKTLTAAIEEANADMLADGVQNMQIRVRLDASGNVTEVTNDMNVQQLDYVKRALQTLAENNRDTVTYKFSPQGRRYARLASDLRRELGEGIIDPESGARVYDEAVKLGGNTIAEENAFRMGQDLLRPKTKIEDVMETLGDDPSEAQLEALRMGMSQYVRNILQDVRAVPSDPDLEARQLDAFYRLTSSGSAREKIAAVMGDMTDDFLRQIDEVGQAAITRASLSRNSATAIRQSTQKGIEEMTSAGPVTKLFQGQPLEATRKMVSELTGFTDEFSENQRMAIYNDVAKALTEVGTDDAIRALNVMRDVQMGRRVSQEARDFAYNRAMYYFGSGVQKPTEQQALEALGQRPESQLPKMGLGLLVQ
jgi:galactitol-specific phosphotransferase system IIB component